MSKTALITGISGQDGAYLARLLLQQNYKVIGTYLKADTCAQNLQALGVDVSGIELIQIDMAEPHEIIQILQQYQPDEVYHLAARTSPGDSYNAFSELMIVNSSSTIKILEYIKNHSPESRFCNASTAFIFEPGNDRLNEESPFSPNNPYGVTKLQSHLAARYFRESLDIFAANAILFNHESPLRPKNFVTSKIVHSLKDIKSGELQYMELGNINARRDWGHAADYVRAMHLMLQAEQPVDYIVASGLTHSVREFVEICAGLLDINVQWQGKGLDEVGVNTETGKEIIKINPQFYRPFVDSTYCGDPVKLERELGWQREYSFEKTIEDMLSL